ncbi:hypothetical protein F4861DRAFT_415680 [Xylaria intraflava]|nr:hypothetical protein F4861DRAFT_415680 [Xylaria intraflava]
MQILMTFRGKIASQPPGDGFASILVIDDGVGVTEFSPREALCVVKGQNFVSSPSGVCKPWFFPETGHGTMMARVISSLSPKAHILVVRTDTGLRDAYKSFSEALDWCIMRRANIVCIGMAFGAFSSGKNPDLRSPYEAVGAGITVLMPVLEPSMGDLADQSFFTD